MLKFFSALLGEDYEMLEGETPWSKKKILLMGSLLFVPVILWFFQGYLLTTNILKQGAWLGLLVGTIGAAIIFIIERSIIMMRTSNRAVTWFRYGLGLVIALIGSIILDEIIFSSDIDNHMCQYRESKLSTDLKLFKILPHKLYSYL
ncbi:MAG: DUF4407 domain-containing protein [Reichenbachiella sp.]|uniref:DUF4407 domain-containing protein n=1 Tax=Reichenbachiella sp. TaxID=2184521 RepID=UPI003296A85B